MIFMKQLTLAITLVLLISCNRDASRHKNQTMLLNETWQLVSIQGEALNIDSEKDGLEFPNLAFDVVEMKYHGSDGCNRIFGGITELDEKHLKFGIGAGTRRMCLEMDIPDQFNKILSTVFFYKLKGQTLLLLNEDGDRVMVLEKL